MTSILIITNKIYDLLKQTEIKNIVLIPDTGQGSKYKKNYSLPIFFNFWQAVQILTGHFFFGLPPTALFAIDEIVCVLILSSNLHLLADKKMKKYMK